MTVSTPSFEDTEGPLEPGQLQGGGGDIAPSLDDPLANLGAEGFGEYSAEQGARQARPVRPRLGGLHPAGATVLTTAVGIGMREPCFATAWTGGGNQQYTHMCYSDIPYMYQGRGFTSNNVPYYSTNTNYYLEYPVVTGAAMETAAQIAKHIPGDANNQGRWFYVITTWFLLIFACISVIALVGLGGSRPWDAAMFALAPGTAAERDHKLGPDRGRPGGGRPAGLGAQAAGGGGRADRPGHGGQALPGADPGGAAAAVLARGQDARSGACACSARSAPGWWSTCRSCWPTSTAGPTSTPSTRTAAPTGARSGCSWSTARCT